ncbi:MAG: cupin domain-containing protein [Oscillibacter sp.]|nr:cupin domain-containing protein [Oscillibacter sp.]MBD5154808.1 cupin domain-containing protein [Oscillibacter sp.]
MLIEFDKMEEQTVPHFQGGEGAFLTKMRVDELGKILRGRLEPGSTIGLHTHDTSSEIIYILAGKGKVLYDGEYEPLSAGSCHYCPKGHSHSLINDSDALLEFFAVVPVQ